MRRFALKACRKKSKGPEPTEIVDRKERRFMSVPLSDSAQFYRALKTREVAGFVMSENLYSPETKVPKHSHEQANFCMALKGACNEVYRNAIREYHPFTLDFFPAGATHSLEIRRAELRCFYFDVPTEWLERMRELSLFADESVHCQGGPLAELFLKLYREFNSGDGASTLAIEGLALEMLATISRGKAQARERHLPRWLEQTKDLLHAHFSEHWRLAGIAKAAGVHPVHLAREFHKHYRLTVGDYVRKLRIEYACHELAESKKSLAEISATAGFADQGHFSRTFRRLTGMTPAEYRRTFSTR